MGWGWLVPVGGETEGVRGWEGGWWEAGRDCLDSAIINSFAVQRKRADQDD